MINIPKGTKDVLPEQYKTVTIEKTGGEERKIIYD